MDLDWDWDWDWREVVVDDADDIGLCLCFIGFCCLFECM